MAAFWDLTVRTRKRRARGVRELRTVYEKYYSGERTFTFDAEKWAIQGASGRQESLWTGLLTTVEKRNVLLLSFRNQVSVGIPKRALTAHEMDLLRKVALQKGKHTWRSRVSLFDFLFTAVPSLWRQHPFLMTEAHVGGLFFYVMISTTMLHERGPGVFVAWIVAWLILFLTVTAQLWYFFIKYKTSHKALQDFWDMGFSDGGVDIRTADADCFRSWTSFTKATETSRCFLLNMSSSQYFIFPKNCMRTDQKEIVRGLLQMKLPATQD